MALRTLHTIFAAQKIKFSIKDFFSKCDQIRIFPADLFIFTEEFHYRKLHFLCSDWNFVEISDVVLKTIYDKIHLIQYVKTVYCAIQRLWSVLKKLRNTNCEVC